MARVAGNTFWSAHLKSRHNIGSVLISELGCKCNSKRMRRINHSKRLCKPLLGVIITVWRLFQTLRRLWLRESLNHPKKKPTSMLRLPTKNKLTHILDAAGG
ncbi:hypothetical protein TcCL_NonESM09120 [Trypanosoma cruzi]|nr:hypothetical protein TcCL_NonESM09120 [Trypanosoma cruzi]